METKEFRIKNLITIAHESNTPVVEVGCIFKDYIQVDGRFIHISFVLPLDLNEAWFLKCGFERKEISAANSFNGNHSYFGDTPFYCWIHKKNTFRIFEMTNPNPKEPEILYVPAFAIFVFDHIKLLHVHQLQNFYYQMIGSELQLNF